MIPDSVLPTVNASLNLVSLAFLLAGYRAVRAGRTDGHRRLMIAALVASALFLTCYLIYHFQVGSVKYPFFDWTRPLYYAVLIPHVLLAAAMTPFIVVIVRRAARGEIESHRRLARWVWPVWVFVAASGVAVYLLLYGRVYVSRWL